MVADLDYDPEPGDEADEPGYAPEVEDRARALDVGPDFRDIELQVIGNGLREKSILVDLASRLNGYEFIDGEIDFLWQVAIENWKQNNEVPSREVFVSAIYRYLKPDDREETLARVDELFAVPASQSVASLAAILRRRALEEAGLTAMERASKKLDEGDPEEALQILGRAGVEGRPSPRSKTLFEGGLRPEPLSKIPSGIMELDEVIGGLVYGSKTDSEMGLIIAVTGMGKSSLTIEFGFTGVGLGFNVLHIDSENGEALVRARYLSRFTEIPAALIASGKMGKAGQERFDAWAARNRRRVESRLRILNIGIMESTLEDVEAETMRLVSEDWKPDLIIFDSPDHLVMDGSAKAQRWEKFAETWNRMARFKNRYSAAMWATSQGDLAFENKIATNGAVADSKNKPRVAQVVVTVNRGLDPETGLFTNDEERCLYVSKNRTGKAHVLVPLQANLKILKFSGVTPEPEWGDQE